MKYIKNKKLQDLGVKNIISSKGMNFKFIEGKEETLQKNVDTIIRELNAQPEEIYSCYQIHSNNIAVIGIDNEPNDFVYGKMFLETDGLITNKENVALITKFADCTPILLYDPVNKVQANLHSGWRGTSLKISSTALDKMKKYFNTSPEDVIAYIGPTIDKDSFEVEEDVVKIYKEAFDYWKDIISRKNSIKYNIDLELCNKLSLLEAGVLSNNIYSAKLSTYKNENLYSYRRDGAKTPLMAMVSIIEG